MSEKIPRVGMMARVRNRFGLIQSVQNFDSKTAEGTYRSVRVSYFDHEIPTEETVIWEREARPVLSEPSAFPRVSETKAMGVENFRALMNACRWSAMSPLLTSDSIPTVSEKQPISSPLYGAIQVEDFQLLPVVKALASPRVAMLIADDTGLGKTIEAGLVLTELIIKRRIRRVMVLCPPNLRTQWQQELREKFGIDFEILDLESTNKYQRQHGLDANPWRGFDKVIGSFYYLKQPNVLEQFRSAAEATVASGQLPWDLLIVDEAHNLAPVPMGEASDLYEMLRQITPFFEHRIFMSATPHNGRTSSFTGLMELLDPVKFMRKRELNATDKRNVAEATVRRLKSEINRVSTPKRFAERTIASVRDNPYLDLAFEKGEMDLFAAFDHFKEAVKQKMGQIGKRERVTYSFAIEVLQKRLLSCPYAFGVSWFKFLDGLQGSQQQSLFDEVESNRKAYEKALRVETDDDQETELRGLAFVESAGAWLRDLNKVIGFEIEEVTKSLQSLSLDGTSKGIPNADARYAVLKKIIDLKLRDKGRWQDEERIIVFTEYKTTLDYLKARLDSDYGVNIVATLFGQMNAKDREKVKISFNEIESPIKILLATDAASEGLNLQETCRYLLHWDIPWNPIRLEQRNGRIDRHGQPRDVTIFHFHSNAKEELSFLSKILEKVDQIKDDLGPVADLFSNAISRFIDKKENAQGIFDSVDHQVKGRSLRRRQDLQDTSEVGQIDFALFEKFKEDLGITENALAELGLAGAKYFNAFECDGPDEKKRFRIKPPTISKNWDSAVEDYLRDQGEKGKKGSLKQITFSPQCFTQIKNGRQLFKMLPDTVYLTMGQPFMQRLMNEFMQTRYEGSSKTESRWSVGTISLPKGLDALIVVYVEELAINKLRESIHHWVRPLVFGISEDLLVLPHEMGEFDLNQVVFSKGLDSKAKDIWIDYETELKNVFSNHQQHLQTVLSNHLPKKKKSSIDETEKIFQSRFGEIGSYIKVSKAERIAEIKSEEDQLVLTTIQSAAQQLTFSDSFQNSFFEPQKEGELEKIKLEEEYLKENRNLEQLLEYLKKERVRLVEEVLPKRYELDGEVKVFPVGVMVVLNG